MNTTPSALRWPCGSAVHDAGSAAPVRGPRIAVVVPCFRVRRHVLGVLARIGPEVGRIYVVDDACPDGTGRYVETASADPRVRVLFHRANQGVGGAMVTGYAAALADGADVVVKVDGDGQMDPSLVPALAAPILDGRADYTKGNRFFDIEHVRAMPSARLVGNAVLSFMSKLSSGYWTVFDPTNGFTAVSVRVLALLPLEKLSKRFFFESDMLFRLGTLRACVLDVPMRAVYGDETSQLRIGRVLVPFLAGHVVNTAKRIFYSYFLRDFSLASVQFLVGAALLLFGTVFGLEAWIASATSGVTASTGTVMLAALPVILGVQLLLSFLAFDIAAAPSRAIHTLLNRGEALPAARVLPVYADT